MASKPFQYSAVGEKLSGHTGINALMQDLGSALAEGSDLVMMGGGNPAHIPAVEQVWRQRLQQILTETGGMESMLGDYDTPRGRISFLEALAGFFRNECGWPVEAENLAVTNGSQTSFFLLLNLFGGLRDGVMHPVLLPMVPEYIGYADQGLSDGFFKSLLPKIELIDEHRFKYHIDFDALPAEAPLGAICLSRPTNPTSNVVSDAELSRLLAYARSREIPLILDNAYGLPFPGIIFGDATLRWEEGMVLTFSLSKLGLPGTRTGIVLADPETIRRIGAMNAVLALSNGSVGQAIVEPLLRSGEISRLVREVILPYYAERCQTIQRWIDEAFAGRFPYRLHVSEGAFFLWLWLPTVKCSGHALYEKLKANGVIVVPGSYFTPGLDKPWEHAAQCLRLSFCQPEAKLRRGVEILAATIAENCA